MAEIVIDSEEKENQEAEEMDQKLEEKEVAAHTGQENEELIEKYELESEDANDIAVDNEDQSAQVVEKDEKEEKESDEQVQSEEEVTDEREVEKEEERRKEEKSPTSSTNSIRRASKGRKKRKKGRDHDHKPREKEREGDDDKGRVRRTRSSSPGASMARGRAGSDRGGRADLSQLAAAWTDDDGDDNDGNE